MCEFRTLEEVPPLYREKWTRAIAIILRRVISAQTDADVNRGLKWFLLSSQVFLREPKRGGRKGQSNGELAARFDCVVRGDWGTLITLLQSAKAVHRQSNTSGQRQLRDEEGSVQANAKLRKTVLGMLSRGQVGRAVRRLCSHGVGSVEDPAVKTVLREKYKERGRDLPASVTKSECMQSISGLRETILGLETGVSLGFGGLRNEHLRCLAEVGEQEDMDRLEAFSLQYLNGDFPPWFSKVWNSVTTVPLFKQDGNIRPVGIKPSFIRTLHRRVVRDNRGVLIDYLEPQQLAVSPAGGAKLVHSVRMLLENRRDFVAVKLDIRNAHNEVSRASIIEAFENEPSLRHLAWHVATCLAPPTGLESNGRLWGHTGEGHSQGDPEASGCFCVAWHADVRDLDATLKTAGGMAKFGNDDGYVIGPPSVLFPAIAYFAQQVRNKHLLHLQVQKTEIFSWTGIKPPEAPPDMKIAGVEVDNVFEPGMLVYGIPVGSECYVRHMLGKVVEDIRWRRSKKC